MKIHEIISESATAGATSAANVGTVVSPHLAIGKNAYEIIRYEFGIGVQIFLSGKLFIHARLNLFDCFGLHFSGQQQQGDV